MVNLDINLKTCETYECDTCDHIIQTISEMKKHIRENCSSTIYHIRVDRKDFNEANVKENKQSEILWNNLEKH